MFAAYPCHLGEVKRGNDRCVCGQSALSTYIQGNNKGYCRPCSIKRDALVEVLTGNIIIAEQENVDNCIISGIEEMRKQIFAGVLYSMIDEFYAKNEKKRIEPYHNEIFLDKICIIKDDMIKLIIKSVQKTIEACSDQQLLQKRTYYLYSRELALMCNSGFSKDYNFDINLWQTGAKGFVETKIKDIDNEIKKIDEEIAVAEKISIEKRKGKSKVINYIKSKFQKN